MSEQQVLRKARESFCADVASLDLQFLLFQSLQGKSLKFPVVGLAPTAMVSYLGKDMTEVQVGIGEFETDCGLLGHL